MIYEVCCGSTDDALMAWQGGAQRIELNSALFLGGLTPSIGALRQVKSRIPIPVMAMLRPREGGFCYTEAEYATMEADAEAFLEAGADGLVFGFLHPDGRIDRERTEAFVRLCRGRQAVFSRAIDVVPDILEGTRQLQQLGLTRVLTSGGRPTASEGADTIREMRKIAGSMEILAGGGVRPDNVRKLVKQTGVTQVHGSCRKLWYDTSVRCRPEICFGGKIEGRGIPEDQCKTVDPEQVKRMQEVLKTL